MTIEIKEKCIKCNSTLDLRAYLFMDLNCTNCFNKQIKVLTKNKQHKERLKK